MSTDGNNAEGTNEGQGTGTGDNQGMGTGEGQGTPKPTLKQLIEEHKLQDEVNTMMAENRRKLTQQNTELVPQLEQLKKNVNLTQDERDALQSRITQLEEQFLTKEELAKREANKQQKKFSEDLERATGETDKWRTMYTSETIDRSLQDAAVEGEALHPVQLVEILRGKTQLAEVIEDGAGTGRYAPIVKFNDIDENGNSVILDLSPTEAIKRMKELPDTYGNLFKGTATSGLGESSSSGASNAPALKELMDDPVKYAKWRKENPDLDITKLKR